MKKEDLDQYPFEVLLEENDGLKYFHVVYRDFPTVDGAGETAEEAIETGREALALVAEEMKEKGQKLPKPTIKKVDDVTGRITLRMPKSLHRKLMERSERDEVSLNTSIVTALAEYLSTSYDDDDAFDLLVKIGKEAVRNKGMEILDDDSYDDLFESTGFYGGRGIMKTA